eukprot:scaffold125798_cov72-Phaeocystis_antarctica.AAC.7
MATARQVRQVESDGSSFVMTSGSFKGNTRGKRTGARGETLTGPLASGNLPAKRARVLRASLLFPGPDGRHREGRARGGQARQTRGACGVDRRGGVARAEAVCSPFGPSRAGSVCFGLGPPGSVQCDRAALGTPAVRAPVVTLRRVPSRALGAARPALCAARPRRQRWAASAAAVGGAAAQRGGEDGRVVARISRSPGGLSAARARASAHAAAGRRRRHLRRPAAGGGRRRRARARVATRCGGDSALVAGQV